MELAAESFNVEDKATDYGMDNPHPSWLSATRGRRDQNFVRTLRLDLQEQIIAPQTIPHAAPQAAVIPLHYWQNIGNAQLDLTPIQATS
ncbi:hypothetical protein [Xanthomonas cannabis]|uniref:hypothetical protein n=1 Tax=Xanthomonas cannabis TaxID=1885674 RepID=UPI00141A6FF7|nr:hypothetical protein [Xanthomonas cannabis]NIK01316.1 hypothetical protein [Xanthomonas cannabis]NIK65549.1 hypothetical protein [Xanthomonas cannabis]